VTGGDRQAGGDVIVALGGLAGPVLVVADNEAIARRAPAWAAGFSACGRPHRVRLVGQMAGDVDDLVVEATNLAATAILAAGGKEAMQAGRAVAARLSLPLLLESDAAVFGK
jgi:hypothetical protein